MTRDNLRIFCTMLGFMVVILKDENADNQAVRARNFARLIESFCFTAEPEALGIEPATIIGEADVDHLDRAIDRYKAALTEKSEAYLPEDRDTLLQFYDRLLTRKTRREQQAFYITGNADIIANRVLQLVTEEIEQDERKTGDDAW